MHAAMSLQNSDDHDHDHDQYANETTSFTTMHPTILAKKNIFLRQLWAFSVAFLLTILSGTVTGFSAILLPQLDAANSTIHATITQQSWIASLAPLQMSIGCLVSGWSMEAIGRKRTLIVCAALFLLGWLLIFFATSIELLLIGRVLTGFAAGYLGPTASCYTAEIASARYRPIFLAAICLGVAVGLLFTHALGTFLYWRTVALIICALPLFVIVVALPVPESHVWLIGRGKDDVAREALEWYSDADPTYITTLIQEQKANQKKEDSPKWQDTVRKREFLRPLMIMNLFFMTAQMSGNNTVVFYSVRVMQQTVPTLNEYAAMLIIDGIRVGMSLVACVLTKRFRIRPLTFVSGAGTVVSLFSLAGFAQLALTFPENAILSAIPLVFLVTYIVSISIGIVPLPWSLSGEILPPHCKGLGGGIATAFNFLVFFAVVKTGPELFSAFGTAVAFAIYGILTMLGVIGLYFVLPETKDKTLEEIQAENKT